MADEKLREKLADYVEDAHAMEQSVLRSLESMISTTDDRGPVADAILLGIAFALPVAHRLAPLDWPLAREATLRQAGEHLRGLQTLDPVRLLVHGPLSVQERVELQRQL